jgi:two-component system nitrate/nitrite response regulator NarL
LKTILIVDDSSAVRHSLRRAIQQRPAFRVCGEAENGREGVEMAVQLRPDLILLDLSMPVMNGLQAAGELQRLLPDVPILMITSFYNSVMERAAIAQGVTAVKSKADSLESLFKKMHELTGAA